jgi:molybdate transport system substrate-binding protein
MLRLTLVLLFFATAAHANPSRNLTIFAEPNLAIALTKIARIYSPKANVIISLNFNSSSNLINNIDSGEPADIFISAHKGWIDSLHQKGVVDVYNVGFIAQDSLVLATLKSNPKFPAELASKNTAIKYALEVLDENKATIILDEEGNSSGFFAKNFFDATAYPNIKIFSKISEDKTPLLTTIKASPENYALLLESQIRNNKDFQIIATSAEKNIFYQALVIAGDNMDVAREFLKFLKTEPAKKIFRESGFITE